MSDVIKLKCRNPNETSFCISVDRKEAEDMIYNPEKWPAGVVIRPYSPSSSTNSKQRVRSNYQRRNQQQQKMRQPYRRFQERSSQRGWKHGDTWQNSPRYDHDSPDQYYRHYGDQFNQHYDNGYDSYDYEDYTCSPQYRPW